jgi:FtsP/CotA-like multicopper oxidase with cupredoxin domain
MNRCKFSIFSLVLIMVFLAWGVNVAQAGPGTLATPPPPDYPASATPSGGTFYANSPLGFWHYTQNPDLGTYTSAQSNSGTPIRKFVDSLPGLGLPGCNPALPPGTPGSCNANNLGQYIPIANADTLTYPGSDYYVIGLKDYRRKMHSDLPLTTDPLGTGTKLRGYYQINNGNAFGGITDHSNQYLGPVILATKDRPVRIKFENHLGAGALGNLFIPVDTTYMGAGLGPDGAPGGNYSENRATLHLHGGFTPWISDGTPHQWVTPILDNQHYPKGVSFKNVPDMLTGLNCAGGAACITPTPTDGIGTFFYTNQQSNRLMFYHDHAYGITRLNVYAGEAAGYLLVDPQEEALITAGTIPNICPGGGATVCEYRYGIPLVIQDKTFVPQDVAVQDALWTNPAWGVYGDLWFPHVYETNQWPPNPDDSGANNFGRWDYGPWFFPPMDPATLKGPLPQPSGVPEAFMDTPVVNGTPYPYLPVQPQAYRFRILNACNDRNLNLQLYVADTTIPVGPSGTYSEVKMVPAVPHPPCSPSITTNCDCNGTNNPVGCFPAYWPTMDARDGGVPDPATVGPAMIQIGSEGGFLPAPVVLPNTPVGFEYNRRNIVVLNVLEKTLFMGPAERADVIIDFSAFAGKTIILYNDSPAPVPAFDPRLDYYTGNPDNTWMGGAPSTLPGYGPNTRTIMQFRVAAGTGTPFNLAPLNTALPAAYLASQPPPVVPQTGYPGAYHAATNTYGHIQDNSLTFTPVGSVTPVTMTVKQKAIQELFELNYGRMNATLGTELPFTNFLTQTTIPLGYIDPATDIITPNEPQIWKITHNGVDTHSIHFHLINVQVINRVGWDGAIRPPDPNELGWKETVRMHPLEDIYVAFKPARPVLPFLIPNSVRPLDVTQPLGSTIGFTGVDPYTNNPITVTNQMYNFGWEYVWHCHLLGHEENDMMRPLVLRPRAPADFDGDFKTDIAVYRSNTGAWYINPSFPPNTTYGVAWGGTGFTLDPGDYDGDGKTDIAIYQASTGIWYIQPSSGAAAYGVGWGGPAFTPIPGDYDGDGKTDIAIYQASTGVWYIKPSSGAAAYGVGWGGPAFTPIPGDYDGDGKTDIAIYQASTGIWYIQPSSGAAAYGVGWGGPAFTPIPGDYDGDGKIDIAVYQASTGAWYAMPSSGAAPYGVGWGGTGFTPIPGDYDQDGIADIAVYQASTGAWYIKPSSGAAPYGVGWGGDPNDVPITEVTLF